MYVNVEFSVLYDFSYYIKFGHTHTLQHSLGKLLIQQVFVFIQEPFALQQINSIERKVYFNEIFPWLEIFLTATNPTYGIVLLFTLNLNITTIYFYNKLMQTVRAQLSLNPVKRLYYWCRYYDSFYVQRVKYSLWLYNPNIIIVSLSKPKQVLSVDARYSLFLLQYLLKCIKHNTNL